MDGQIRQMDGQVDGIAIAIATSNTVDALQKRIIRDKVKCTAILAKFEPLKVQTISLSVALSYRSTPQFVILSVYESCLTWRRARSARVC